ncbi:hypothetical protein CHS0354_031406 [Potamilus streckersoni]|uniref:Transmembrane protein 26 n=1 Tax=Potamilus streckersoni TaxID=2493646 RepID=A0AAE0S284_9BIVA|nr:hypothetical protein CHS0354_031406 [Potamilus streckersoni]
MQPKFCPSVFIYLTSSVPAIWFLELHEFEKRMIEYLASNHTPPLYYTDQYEDLSAPLGSVLGVKFEIRIPIEMTSDQWIRTLEQILLLILILGRWLLPKGKLTHDQLSQLLLVYIGTAADIVEFFEAFKEVQVRYDKILCMAILGLWSLSLVQFSLVLTAARARRDQSGLLSRRSDIQSDRCCGTDVFGIIISILLQDLPFLVLRMLLIFRYHVLSYSNMFFTCKNTLVIVLLLYRLIVVFVQRRLRETELLTDSPKIKIPPIPTSPSHSCTGSLESRSILLSLYPTKNTHPVPRVYQLREEKHKWGRAYHFEEVE